MSMIRAQDLAMPHLLKPADAAILACCIQADCAYLFTNDAQLIRNTANLSVIKVISPLEAVDIV